LSDHLTALPMAPPTLARGEGSLPPASLLFGGGDRGGGDGGDGGGANACGVCGVCGVLGVEMEVFPTKADRDLLTLTFSLALMLSKVQGGKAYFFG